MEDVAADTSRPADSLILAHARSRPVTTADTRLLLVPGALGGCFPEGAIRRGSTLAISSARGGVSLALALAAAVTGSGCVGGGGRPAVSGAAGRRRAGGQVGAVGGGARAGGPVAGCGGRPGGRDGPIAPRARPAGCGRAMPAAWPPGPGSRGPCWSCSSRQGTGAGQRRPIFACRSPTPAGRGWAAVMATSGLAGWKW